MEFEDSRFALFPEPNAYIQRFEKCDEKVTKKIVFQEPYEKLPNFYLNNDFVKHDCNCIKSKKDKFDHDCNCNHGNNHITSNHNECFKSQTNDCKNESKGFGFDIKSLLPLLSLFNKSGSADFGQMVGLFNNINQSQTGNNLNPINLISNILSNKDAMSGILNLFKGGGLNVFKKKQADKKELKTTDFEIKNYTRVE